MTDLEMEHAEAAHAAEITNEHGFRLFKYDKASYLAGFEAGLDYMTDDNNAMEDVARKLLNERDSERARSAQLQEENEKLRYDAQKIYADYMDRGASMRDTGDMVRSLYAPTNERLNKEVGKLTRQLKVERARSAKLIERLRIVRTLDSPSKVWSTIDHAIAEYEASRD